jgi:hypothetical protein
MLSLFPELLDWYFFVPTLFRIILGTYLLFWGWRMLARTTFAPTPDHPSAPAASQAFGICFIALSALLYAGYLIQLVGAIVASLGILAILLRKKHPDVVPESVTSYVFLTTIAFSLIFLGPGAFAVDIPL